MIKVLKQQDDNGQYKDDKGKRYNLIYGAYAVGPRADEFQEFDNLEQAMQAYGLEEYHEPVIKEIEEEPKQEEVAISKEENTTEE